MIKQLLTIKILTLFITLLPGPFVFSQVGSKSSYLETVKEEDRFINRLFQLIPLKEKYQYREFQDGRVFYAPHKESPIVKLNFNRYFSHVSMIDEKGDTTFVANFENIKYVLIKKDLFYYDFRKGYFEILSNPDDSIKLTVKRQLNLVKRETLKDYEKPLNVSTKKRFSTIYIPVNTTLPREQVTFSRDDIYYLMNEKNETILANKAAFLKLFPKHKQAIEKHISELARQRKRIKFDREEDLKSLLVFCVALQENPVKN